MELIVQGFQEDIERLVSKIESGELSDLSNANLAGANLNGALF